MTPPGTWTGRLAVATPSLTDPNFSRTVVLLLQHDADDGAFGLILNVPMDTTVQEILPEWAFLTGDRPQVFEGGPVSPNTAVCLARSRPGAAAVAAFAPLENVPRLGTVDLDASPLEMAEVIEEVRLFAGYAGWSAGQLESECDEGAWWVLDLLPGDVFSATPELLWSQVLRRQGPPLAFAAIYPADPGLN
ncbi:MAG: YqgE/AlgH family protein [Actinomycetota bacterium]|nr:YqgE/AlgH family protein [Actinomycetota bacterium]